jgi:formimidoylglutamate deiminase
MTAYRAQYLIAPDGVIENGVLTVEDGKISALGTGAYDVDLGAVAIAPGMVNGHSHAFQRLIRGRTEYVLADKADDDFWSWRTQMYAAADTLDPAGIEIVSRMTFLEMALSGISTVGEFHYVHHHPGGALYADPNELANRVIQAAQDVGIRINLLRVAYHRGGYNRGTSPQQARFKDESIELYLERVAALTARWKSSDRVSVGFAPHSIRAVSGPWLSRIAKESEQTGQVIHIHACEQRRELAESITEYGAPPIPVFADRGLLSARTTVVHATHLDERDLDLLQQFKPTVCACPTTERNLGDGFLPTTALFGRDIPVCLGTDSQAQIDLWEDARLLEYHERLRSERRNVLAAKESVKRSGHMSRVETGALLWPCLNTNGARALGLDVGSLLPGTAADFVTIDLNDVSMAGTDAQSIVTDLVFSLQTRAVRDVYVGGRAIVTQGRHRAQADIVQDYLGFISR